MPKYYVELQRRIKQEETVEKGIFLVEEENEEKAKEKVLKKIRNNKDKFSWTVEKRDVAIDKIRTTISSITPVDSGEEEKINEEEPSFPLEGEECVEKEV